MDKILIAEIGSRRRRNHDLRQALGGRLVILDRGHLDGLGRERR